MNKDLQNVLNIIEQSPNFNGEEKDSVSKSLKNADKELEITAFKLDRTEKVKKTTAILLEETIEELEQKRKAVELQNRELEIETALERVRTVAMGMKHPADMLDVCRIISAQLQLLNITHIRNIQTAIFYESRGIYLNYEYFIIDDKTVITEVEYNLHADVKEFVNKMLQDPEAFFTTHFEGAKLQEWMDYQEKANQYLDLNLHNTASLHYYFYSIGPGALGISTYAPLNEDHLVIFKRFRNVFELAYRRFHDIEQAEAQAREAQIQLALERVRARTMAMQQSEELPEAANTLFLQVQALGIPAWSAGYCIWDEDKKAATACMSSEGVIQKPFKLPTTGDPSFVNFYEAYKRGELFYVEELGGEALVSHYQFMRTLPVVGEVLDGIINAGFPLPTYQIFHVAYFSQGYLLFITYEPVREAHAIFKRFTNVFEQTYTRFLDLQKAEAQAREARIEAALERIRSKSLAMYKTENLGDVVSVLLEQMQGLSVDMGFTSVSIYIFEEGTRNHTLWIPLPNGVKSLRVPYFEHPIVSHLFDARESGADYFEKAYTVEEKNTCAELSFELTDYRYLPEEFKAAIREAPGYAMSIALAKNSGICVPSVTGQLPSAEDIAIMKRVSRVFEQAYIRFLDLQKAEAQAREARIEVALEKVRSRTMGMQQSHELGDVATVLFKELNQLVENLWTCGFVLCEKNRGADEWWLSTGDGFIPAFYLPNTVDPTHANIYDGWKKGETYHTEQLEGEALQEHYDWLMNIPVSKNIFDEMKAAGNSLPTWQKLHCAYFSYGYLVMITQVPCPEEQIFKRFAQVFDQTYTRFLDLQKAEAQARESQIQLAMERVRARTMAMQKSDELAQAANLLFQQMQSLDIPAFSAGYCIWSNDKQAATFWMSSEGVLQPPFTVPLTENPMFIHYREGFQRGETFYAEEFNGEELAKHYQYMLSVPDILEMMKKVSEEGIQIPAFPTFQVNHVVYFAQGFLLFVTYKRVPEVHDIFKRFGKVFEQTYTRFLDLQKAEAQAREAQIEAALERVRSRSMGMQKSEELRDIIQVIYEQFIHLGFKIDSAGFATEYMESDDFNFWLADSTSVFPKKVHVPYFDHPQFNRFKEAKEKGLDFYASNLTFEEKNQFWEYVLRDAPSIPQEVKETLYNAPGYISSHVLLKNIVLYILSYTDIPFSDAENAILMRFGKAFEQAYIRFLDLQKSEAQTREAQIEAALEKVRSRSLAMHKSDELNDVVTILFGKLKELQIPVTAVGIAIYIDGSKDLNAYVCGENEAGLVITNYRLPYFNNKITNDLIYALENQLDFFVGHYSKEEKNSFYKYILEHTAEFRHLPDDIKRMIFESPTYTISMVAVKNAVFNINDFEGKILVENEIDIIKRFTRVFDQAYTRFLDLKKAEAQAQEARIEAALERVRSRAMAMHKTDELLDAGELIYKELTALGIESMNVSYAFVDEDEQYASYYGLNPVDGKMLPIPFVFPHTETDVMRSLLSSWKKQEPFNVIELDEEATVKHQTWIGEHILQLITKNKIDIPFSVEAFLAVSPKKAVIYSFNFTKGYLFNIGEARLTTLQEEMVLRFTKVFDMTYRRFLDLKQAEEQAREAQIEAALERVRSRTMAMQRSEELQDASLLLFQQVQSLGIPPFACGFNIWDADRKAATAWMGSIGGLQIPFKTDTSKDVYLPIYEAAQRGESLYVVEQAGKALEDHYGYLATIPIFRDIILEGFKRNGISVPTFQIIHCAYFSQGYLMFISYEPVPFAYDIFKRFAKVFEQTYTRFLDLQKAEAQAKEAIKASSLDRVRAEIASMRTVDDLQRITPLIWHELTALGVPFVRCGVFIIDEAQAHVQVYLSAPDGHSLAVLDLPFTSNTLTSNAVDHWRKGVVYTEHWTKEDFISWTKSMMEQGQVQSPETYQGATQPPETLDLHFVPFSQGMLYAGNIEPLTTDEISLVKALAESFSIAYARYEDFKQLEKAKQHIEATLTELKATQSQLIQSEKMASLGQLTAGIAHEIQNPLNFVNNFSEVNAELIEELKGERQKAEGERNTQLEDELLNDLLTNMEKINHHGKRADAIVKGMLQHSRSSSGIKEPTDINALADEYLRLSYHGLRAKDKSFNATLKTDYDESIGKINIIPQDIGRVLLNLINNAFYATQEKKKLQGDQYEPIVTVSSSLNPPLASGGRGTMVLISITDNGNGIPQKILDNIFQPFFTTKPTGQGTGLGLSLSYDIVKAHGGEIKVETKENEGTEFIIQLPVV